MAWDADEVEYYLVSLIDDIQDHCRNPRQFRNNWDHDDPGDAIDSILDQVHSLVDDALKSFYIDKSYIKTRFFKEYLEKGRIIEDPADLIYLIDIIANPPKEDSYRLNCLYDEYNNKEE